MKVLQLISSAGYYGAENMLVTLSDQLRQLGCEPAVGAFRHPDAPEPEVLRFAARRGLATVSFPCDGRFDRRAIRALREYLRTNRVGILHSHGYKVNMYGWLAARPLLRGQKIRLVSTCHNWAERTGVLALYSVLDRVILRRFDDVVAVSDGVARRMSGFGIHAPQLKVIHNGIETERFRNAQPVLRREFGLANRLVIGTVSRLVPGKGCHVILDAMKEVLRETPDAVFVAVGAGPLESELKDQAARLGIGERVIFAGTRDDIPEVYASLDVFILASFDEGLPMSILEAMAAGVPVVATPVGGIPQLIQHHRTGVLVQPGDTAGTRDALLELFRSPSLRASLGEAARMRVAEQFSAAVMARHYLRLYEQDSPPAVTPSAAGTPHCLEETL
jgi:glycosyltransferase involved in cell wall biosynthesis